MQRILAAHMATVGLVLAGGLIAGLISPEPRTPKSIARNAGPAGVLVKLPPISSSVPQSRPVLKSADRQQPARPVPEAGQEASQSPEKLAGVHLARKVPPADAPQSPTPVAKPPAPLKELSVKPAKPLDEKPLTPDLSRGPANLRVASVGQMTATFRQAGFDLDQAVQTGRVPRIAIETLPPDWVARRMTAPERKKLFFEMMLPLVLIANDEIMADRQKILRLTAEGETLSTGDQAWLDTVLKKYRLSPKKAKDRGPETADILARVDAVPPALTLAQGAIESAWGRSRFARQGNAMFGQWTWQTGQGIVPTGREAGKTHEVRAFKTLLASVRAYMRNLNTSRAYREMRAERADLRAANRTVTGKILARHLNRYSEEGEAYVEKVQKMIRVNRLDRFDTMGLTDLL